jgi:anti-anti-sigma regulatory factor
LNILAYKDDTRVAVEIPGVVDFHEREHVTAVLLEHLRTCQEPELVVHLHNPLVTATALGILSELHRHAADRAVTLRVVVPPLAVKVFTATGLEHLLHVRPAKRAGRV